MEEKDAIVIDFSHVRELGGGDDTFLMALLMKMCKTLPESFQQMHDFCAAGDWPGLKSAAHKAKSTFAYLSLDDMRNRLKEIELDAMESRELDQLPVKVEQAIRIGNTILGILKAELAKLMG